jgi:hypothetical protein
MNIDDLKDAWGQDEPKDMQIPVSTAMLGKTTSVIARLRKNMKAEFIALLVSYAILITYIAGMSVYGGQRTFFFLNAISILLFTVLVLNCFYYSRFYIFYRSISRYDFNMRESIRKMAYELELNTEIYKTYNICVAPLSVLVTITLISGKGVFDYIQRVLVSDSFISPGNLLFAFSIILISFLLTYFCISRHVRLQYGKYITELKRVADDLGQGE